MPFLADATTKKFSNFRSVNGYDSISFNPFKKEHPKLPMKSLIVSIGAVFAFITADGKANAAQLPSTDTIYVNLGDKLSFEVKIDSAGHLSFSPGSKNPDQANTISISVKYNAATGTMLQINNPFGKQLIYTAEIYSPGKQQYMKTSTVPVFPNISSFETWPGKIEKLRLTGFMLR